MSDALDALDIPLQAIAEGQHPDFLSFRLIGVTRGRIERHLAAQPTISD